MDDYIFFAATAAGYIYTSYRLGLFLPGKWSRENKHETELLKMIEL